MVEIKLEKIQKSFDKKKVLDNISLTFQKGKLTAILGPSGCGKTTLMRIIAGFVKPDYGQIYFDNMDVTSIPPQKRDTAMVFQNYALWPHMTVYQNIAYGLKVRGFKKDEIKRLVDEIINIVNLKGMENKFPAQLSGGQQQRVALARALVVRPQVLLLDEPLSNLDAKIRKHLRTEIKNLQKLFKITTIYVTHDQEEAMALADEIVILNGGKVEQVGLPKEIYLKPASLFVADFMGNTNVIEVNNRKLVFRSTDAFLTFSSSFAGDIENSNYYLKGYLIDKQYLGGYYRYYISYKNKCTLLIDLPEDNALDAEINTEVIVGIPHHKIITFEDISEGVFTCV